MLTLEQHAVAFRGWIEPSGAVRVPAAQLIGFLHSADASSVDVPYIDCLFVSDRGTEPSMMLSGSRKDFADFPAFIAFAEDAVAQALTRSRGDGSTACFEDGP
jgi:hypothetical protein